MRLELGYHCSHEQWAPAVLLQHARRAEAAGFRHAMCSDHLYPWSARQGQSGFAWSWLGSALEATGLTFGTVNAPGQRYHPAVVAQAAATLAAMYPGRFWVAVGSGENLNESVTGAPWPSRPRRQQRLVECADALRRLWAGETVDHSGEVVLRAARLDSRPEQPPLLVGAALREDTARLVAGFADALVLATCDPQAVRRLVAAFHDGGGSGRPVFVQCAFASADTEEAALAVVHDQWRQCVLSPDELADLPDTASFDRRTASIRPDDLRGRANLVTDLHELGDRLEALGEAGAHRVYLHELSRDVERFLDQAAEHLLPRFA